MWDTAKVRNRVNVISVLDRIVDNITQTIAQIGLRCDGDGDGIDVLSRSQKMVISMKIKWETRLGSNHLEYMETTVSNVGEPIVKSLPLDFAGDDDWMRDFFVFLE